jgi:hypothetical protein
LKNLYVVDLNGSGDLHDGLVQKAAQVGAFTCKSANVDQNAHMTPDIV